MYFNLISLNHQKPEEKSLKGQHGEGPPTSEPSTSTEKQKSIQKSKTFSLGATGQLKSLEVIFCTSGLNFHLDGSYGQM